MSRNARLWSWGLALALGLTACSSESSSNSPTGAPAPVMTGKPGMLAYETTPTPVGLGARTVTLSPSAGMTLAQAFAQAQPGDDIVLQPGTYAATGSLRLTSSGTSSAWIRVRGASGARPTIDLQSAGELNIAASFVVFEDLEVVNGGGNNIHIAPMTQSITTIIVRRCRSDNVQTGPGAALKINGNNGQSATVGQVYIEDCELTMSNQNAIVDGVGVQQAVVRGCDIHDNRAGSHGIFFKGGSRDILIENNVIRGIRGNAALQLGGNTGAGLFHPSDPNQEGASQIARNNLIADFDDSAVEIRGVNGGQVYHNTFVTETGFAIVRLQFGNTDAGGQSGNENIDVTNNLVIALGASAPQYARNDANAPSSLIFGRQLWGGDLANSGSPGPGVPTFPRAGDIVVARAQVNTVLQNPSAAAATSSSAARGAYALIAGSPAIGAGSPNIVAACDVTGALRSSTTPSIGAFESP